MRKPKKIFLKFIFLLFFIGFSNSTIKCFYANNAISALTGTTIGTVMNPIVNDYMLPTIQEGVEFIKQNFPGLIKNITLETSIILTKEQEHIIDHGKTITHSLGKTNLTIYSGYIIFKLAQYFLERINLNHILLNKGYTTGLNVYITYLGILEFFQFKEKFQDLDKEAYEKDFFSIIVSLTSGLCINLAIIALASYLAISTNKIISAPVFFNLFTGSRMILTTALEEIYSEIFFNWITKKFNLDFENCKLCKQAYNIGGLTAFTLKRTWPSTKKLATSTLKTPEEKKSVMPTRPTPKPEKNKKIESTKKKLFKDNPEINEKEIKAQETKDTLNQSPQEASTTEPKDPHINPEATINKKANPKEKPPVEPKPETKPEPSTIETSSVGTKTKPPTTENPSVEITKPKASTVTETKTKSEQPIEEIPPVKTKPELPTTIESPEVKIETEVTIEPEQQVKTTGKNNIDKDFKRAIFENLNQYNTQYSTQEKKETKKKTEEKTTNNIYQIQIYQYPLKNTYYNPRMYSFDPFINTPAKNICIKAEHKILKN